MSMRNQPIKRSEYLKELSRDHHDGLLFCWEIKQGLSKKIELERLRKYVDYFWINHLEEHFKEEEELLFKHLDDPLCDKAKEDHQLIQKQVELITNSIVQQPQNYIDLIEMLNNHIRFEERELFSHLENILPLEILQATKNFFSPQNYTANKNNYADEFWVKV